jgi:hypothetical protein
MATTIITSQIDFIYAKGEKVFLKSIPSTCVNILAIKWTLCLAIESLALYLILKIHLQLIGLQPYGRGISIQVLLFCKDWNLESMAFFQCFEFHHSMLLSNNGVNQYQHQQKK